MNLTAEQPTEVELEPAAPARPGRVRLAPWVPTVDRLVSLGVVLGCMVFVVVQLHPSKLVLNTMPAGGDMGAHVWAPAYLKDHLLPHGRLTGWSPDWYAGFPVYHFYMVVPSLLILLLWTVLPYGVAFKLVTVAGLVAMPAAAWALGRLAGFARPGPELLAVASLPFIFDTRFTIYGGNAASTLAGEFAFSISLAIALVYLGLVLRGLDTGGRRATAAGVLALVALCHLIPAIFVAIATLVLLALHPGRRRVWWVVTVGAVALALAFFWIGPFFARRAYLNDMGWEKLREYRNNLLPGGPLQVDWLPWRLPIPTDRSWQIVFALAAVGLVLSLVRRERLGLFLAVMAVVLAGLFVVWPQWVLWNARLLPFYYFSLYLLAAVGVAELLRLAGGWPVRTAGTLAGLGVVMVAVGLPLGTLPGSQPRIVDKVQNGQVVRVREGYTWLGLSTKKQSFVKGWANWNYSGYERKTAYPEYYDVVTEMGRIGREVGCGRAHWEYEKELDRYGTPMALMLLPHWTDGCIGSMEGLYFESSATTPYHFLMQSELSKAPSRAQRDVPYGQLDIARGVKHLQLMGVRYYMAFSEPALAGARANPDLVQVGESKPWVIFEVRDAGLVTPLSHEPTVVTDLPSGQEWVAPAAEFFNDPAQWTSFPAASGPPEWPRAKLGEPRPGAPTAPTTVSNIRTGDDFVSFEVDQVGTPVLVKVSYFPNWEASGAKGPYRVAPNLMVVVPTSTEVRLHYGRTAVDVGSWAVTLGGVAGLVVLARRPPLSMVRRRRRRSPEVVELDHLGPEWAAHLPGAPPAAPDGPTVLTGSAAPTGPAAPVGPVAPAAPPAPPGAAPFPPDGPPQRP
ncbi:MAG: 6-pyruvoyl-tetrahydropterin synthase-related protein [Acidimicrobiales bacterium]